ncbi:MAG: hypothetical protein HFH79_10170 [Lachnospiraceae bacterium]|nr:hypothetical protein [Lachnospiraceae bacterium]
MVVRRLRKTLKRSLSIAMAAALMVTSVPELSVTAAEQEAVSEQDISEETAPAETEEGASQDGSTAEGISTEITSAEQKEDTAETQESSTEQHETKSVSETESASDTQSMTEREDSIESETETVLQTETETEEETTESDAEAETEERIDKEEEAVQGTIIFENDFESKSVGDKSDEKDKSGTVVKIGDNQVMEYTVALQGTGWEQAFATSYALPQAYETPVKEKLTMEFDIYIPDSAENSETRTVADFGTMKLQLVLNNGDNWDWLASNSYPEIKADSFTASDIDGYSKKHVSVDITGNKETDKEWDFTDLTSLKAVTIKAVGDTSTYQGKMYIDNVVLKDTSAKTETPDPDEPGDEEEPMEGDLVYENNFDEVTDLSAILADTSGATLADIAEGNKAIKYSANLTGDGWENIFQAQFNLASPYSESITSKVIMGFDVYFPEDSVGEGFGKFKAQAVLKSGDGWKWTQAKNIPEYSVTELKGDADVPGYKKLYVRIDMTEFESGDEVLQPNQVTPIMAVIPCLAGAGSSYQGDLYLDNLKVWAVNETTETPDPTEDVVLDLDASAWKITEHFDYSGDSRIENKTINNKKLLAVSLDYSKNTDKGWSEAKFNYEHSTDVASLKGYNAFVADVYYKPSDKSAGSLSIKLFATSPVTDKVTINSDAALPEGEAVTIPGLEGYYKAEYVLEKKYEGAFRNMTLGFIGKNTDFVGDVYFDNMRFTKVTAPDIYVDATIEPKKGNGIQVVDEGRSIQTASGQKILIDEQVALVDAKAIEATKNLYAYLKAVGESDSVIFGHQNDTHHKAGNEGEDFSNSDTKDVTGSIAGVIGIDTLSLTGNEASEWNTPEAERIENVARITKEAAAEGALVTLSAHMPNFDLIDKRVKNFEASGGTTNETLGYWEVDGEKQYNFSGYTPGTLTGNVVARIMPGQDLNYLYTDYLDLVADYAKAVEGDGITILFRPLHENTGSWFWWGAAHCDEQAYIALYRYTVDYLKETRQVHNMLYVYGPGSEAANAEEYATRYPGDSYVDMIGYDLYHQNPSPDNEEGYLQSISKQNSILKEFAAAHHKLYAITETGVADKNAQGADIALKRTGNKVMDWYMKLLDQISEDKGICYFLVWANFDENGSFYLPYVTEKKENGVLHGHEMMDEFIKFYNDNRSVFATDMNSGFKNITGVTNTTTTDAVSGYITAPQSGDRLLAGSGNTRMAARISGGIGTAEVQFIASAGSKEVILKAVYNENEGVWEALMTDDQLLSLGEIPGMITLKVGDAKIAEISARFNLKEPVKDDMVPEDFEGYAGSNRELNSKWTTNKDTGSEITLNLTEEKNKVFGGKYGMQMDITLAKKDAWVGATKSFEADWSEGNALELYTIPEPKGQKVVVQVKSGEEEFEVYLQEYEEYTKYAATGTPVKVTIPFSAFVGKKQGKFDPANIQVIGLWCNALPNETVTYPLETTICYDELRVVKTEQTTVQITEAAVESENEDELALNLDASSWNVVEGWQYTGQSTLRNETLDGKKYLAAHVDYSKDTDKDWSEAKFDYIHPSTIEALNEFNTFKVDVYYKPTDKKSGSFAIKLFSNIADGKEVLINDSADLPEGVAVEIPGMEGYYKAEYVLEIKIPEGAFHKLTLGLVGKNTDFVGDIYFGNMRFVKTAEPDLYVDSTLAAQKGAGIQVVDNGKSIQTASGNKVGIASEVALVDANANEAARNLYAYLKAVGESDSVIFGHQNDTHHKAGSKGEGFSSSDTEDVTGSIAGVVGIDVLSLTGNEASTWDAPEAERIANLAAITKEAAAKGAVITLSAHMPNFEVIDKRVKAYEASGETGKDNDTLGYWKAEDGSRQYNFSGYTPGTLTGNIVKRIMPGQDLNYLYTDYLDLIADYAKAVENDGITLLFRPFHENTGSWFWWGAALCDEQAYINLYRYTVDYMKETKGVHNMLYVYGPGSEAANVEEYTARYPGDDYVDMIGYDLYHQNPSPENEAGYLQSVSKQNGILKEFAAAHNKLYAITETGVADKNSDGADVALQRTGNKVKDWYMQLLDQISKDGGVCYFLVWANFSENGSFYLPYVTEKKENGVLHGHEMIDEFIRFYNDGRSVFATDMNNGFKQISGVVNTTKPDAVSGYITSPQSGDRILPDKEHPNTQLSAKVSGADPKTASVQFVAETEFDKVILKASYNEEKGLWEAVLKDSSLLSLDKALGTITLYVNDNEVAKITIQFNMEAPVQNDMIPEDFEGYNGDNQQLSKTWATNKASGSEISFALTDDPEKVFGGKYGLKMDITFAAGDAWAGATKGMNADWSAGNALEFYTIPEQYGQKVVVQVTAGGNTIFETYLQEYESYTANAKTGFPVKVTIPFTAFVGRDNKEAKFDPAKIESIGLWCNAISKEDLTFPLSTTLYYDELKVVSTDKTEVTIEALAKEGIWIKEIPAQTYTGKAIKPEVQVYDYAKPLTLKKDYTVSYRNNTNKGEAEVIIKGKGNYAQTITGKFTIQPKQISELEITATDYLIYNGKEQNISVTVKDGKKKLSAKKDYTQTITYVPDAAAQGTEVQKAKEAGLYNIKIAMKGNYDGEVTIPCKVMTDKELLTKAKITLPSSALDYKDGEEVTFDPSQILVKLGSKVVPQKAEDGTTDNYTISYRNNTEVGTASVVIQGIETGKYVGSCTKTFAIKGTPFSKKTIEISGLQTKLPYTGKSLYQNPVLKDKQSGSTLEKNVDYKITYTNNRNAGKATMLLTGINKYSGEIKQTFTIDKVTLTAELLQQNALTVKQNRAGVTPDVALVYEGRTLVNGVDYKLTYTNNKNTTTDVKKAYISIAGIGNFKGSLKNAVTLTIEPKSWDSQELTVEVPDLKYKANTREYKPNAVVYDNGAKLVKNKDYTIEYELNKKEDITLTETGTLPANGHVAKVIITLTGADYTVKSEDAQSSKKTVEFRITEKLISEAKVAVKPDKIQYFSQKGTRPGKEDLTVTYKNTPVADDDYTIISYEKNDQKGKATLVIKGNNSFSGTKKVTFTIKPRDMKANFKDAVAKIMSAMMEQL